MSKTSLTIEQKMAKLDELTQWFDSSDFTIEQAIPMYKEAEALASEIERELADFKNEIVVLKKKFDQDAA